MKKFLLSVLVLIGAQAQAQVTTVDCDLTYMVVNVGSNPNSVNIYHSGHYLTHPQEYNVIAWEITDTQGNLISQDTIIENAFYAFSHDMPITDTINVSAHLTNDSAIHEGFPVSCLLEDQLYWEITEVIPGSFISSWSFVHGNLGVDQNSALDSCIGNPIEGCVSIAVWDPVCGCDDETYSNSADAACNSIYEYTNGECIEVIYGCTNPINQFNYNPSATVDDSSCIPFMFGCINIMANNYDVDANIDDGSCVWFDCEGELSYTSLNILVEDSVCHNNLYCEDYNWDGGDCVYDCNNNLLTIWDIDTYFYNGQCDQILNCMVYNFDNQSCIVSPNSECGSIQITVNNGWNMIGFSCNENTDAIEAFSSIQDKIVIAKDASGNTYLASFNFNGIGDLERGMDTY